MRLFDSHCHLDDPRLAGELELVLQQARAAGVQRITTIGCASSLDSLRSALEIARQHPDWIHATAGVHPHDAKTLDDALLEELARVAQEPEIVAVGETGLDYYYDHSPREVQAEAFRKQIALARGVKKPLVIHTRDAPGDTLAILREEQARDVGGIIHCFSEDATFAKHALDLGFVSSFSGIVTFKNATDVQEAARRQPLDALLVETDAPYLAPLPHRGKRNEPAFVAHTAEHIAALRGDDPEVLAEAAFQNTLRVFGLAQA